VVDMLRDLLLPGIPVVEKIVRPLVIYGFLVLILRVQGQRALAQMNPFDLVVLLTLSNTVQNAIIGNDNSLLGGMIGATTLVLANLLTIRFLYRHPRLDRTLEGQPVVLVRNGRILQENLDRTLITRDELMAAIHRQGILDLADVREAILETSGTISVFPREREEMAALAPLLARLDRLERMLADQGELLRRLSPPETPRSG
jgi:uncharacterized membrane protein YcaP (DUF421 family)